MLKAVKTGRKVWRNEMTYGKLGLIVLLLFGVFAMEVHGQGIAGGTMKGRVSARAVVIRARPGTNYENLGKFEEGDVITIVGEVEGWYRVEVPKSVSGWVPADGMDDTGIVHKNILIYSGPGIVFTTIGKSQIGDHLTAREKLVDGFREIDPPAGVYAWVSKAYIQIVEGSQTGGTNHVIIEDCTFNGEYGFKIKTARDRGGDTGHIIFRNSTVNVYRNPILIHCWYKRHYMWPEYAEAEEITPTTPVIHDILIQNITCSAAHPRKSPIYGYPIAVSGLPESPITNVTFDNVKATGKKGMLLANCKVYFVNKCTINGTSPAEAIQYKHNAEIH